MYTERYMDTPAENPEGYAATALPPLARDLQDDLLLITGVQDDVVLVGIDGADVIDHVLDLLSRLGVFLADVPVEREGVAEAGDDFAAVEHALGTEFSTVEGCGDIALLIALAVAVVVDFGFLEFEVEIEALGGGVVENNAPLI
jgi:hypothetical protein